MWVTDEELNEKEKPYSALPMSALPGLNMATNLVTLTSTERNLFIQLAPEVLKDPGVLMDFVSQEREKMMSSKSMPMSTP